MAGRSEQGTDLRLVEEVFKARQERGVSSLGKGTLEVGVWRALIQHLHALRTLLQDVVHQDSNIRHVCGRLARLPN